MNTATAVTGWASLAACAGEDEAVFFPDDDDPHAYEAARLICGSCPVRAECLHEALSNDSRFGMLGGLTPAEREALVSPTVKQNRRSWGQGCGTTNGYQRHRRAGETPCRSCRRAHADYVLNRRGEDRRLADSLRAHGLASSYERGCRCEPCVEAHTGFKSWLLRAETMTTSHSVDASKSLVAATLTVA